MAERPSKGVAKRYERGSEEFSRTLALSDGVFAIAMTLLVITIALPTLRDGGDTGELLDALSDLTPSVISFFISFAVIARYWAAHQAQCSMLVRMDRPFVGLNLLYLAFIALLPFPTDLLGNYFENPVAVSAYAVNVAIVSGMESVLFWRAERAGLLASRIPEPVFRYGMSASLLPVLFFLLSIPIGFAVNTTVAVLSWLLMIPMQTLLDHRRPPDADEYLA